MPANKPVSIDSSKVALQLANEKLILGEDSLIESYVNGAAMVLEKSGTGLWYKIYTTNNNRNVPKQVQQCKIAYKVLSLDNKVLFSETKTITIGKKQVINGIEQALLCMSSGDSAVLIVPWYIGYGTKGDKNVPAYTSVVVHLRRDL